MFMIHFQAEMSFLAEMLAKQMYLLLFPARFNVIAHWIKTSYMKINTNTYTPHTRENVNKDFIKSICTTWHFALDQIESSNK